MLLAREKFGLFLPTGYRKAEWNLEEMIKSLLGKWNLLITLNIFRIHTFPLISSKIPLTLRCSVAASHYTAATFSSPWGWD